MRLLFDQNISFRIVRKILEIFPEAKQVRELQLENASDLSIWQYAKTNEYCLVTFDSDFIDISTLKGFPPKVIWLRTGNSSTDHLAERLIAEKDAICDFILDENLAVLEIE